MICTTLEMTILQCESSGSVGITLGEHRCLSNLLHLQFFNLQLSWPRSLSSCIHLSALLSQHLHWAHPHV